MPPAGEVTPIHLERLEPGTFRLVPAPGEDAASIARLPVWLLPSPTAAPIAQLVADDGGWVRDVPVPSRPVLISLGPSALQAVAELSPEELTLDPPAEVEVPPLGRIVVELAPGDLPSPELEAAAEGGLRCSPRWSGRAAAFEHLRAGR